VVRPVAWGMAVLPAPHPDRKARYELLHWTPEFAEYLMRPEKRGQHRVLELGMRDSTG
jgi:hypothetical protein